MDHQARKVVGEATGVNNNIGTQTMMDGSLDFTERQEGCKKFVGDAKRVDNSIGGPSDRGESNANSFNKFVGDVERVNDGIRIRIMRRMDQLSSYLTINRVLLLLLLHFIHHIHLKTLGHIHLHILLFIVGRKR